MSYWIYVEKAACDHCGRGAEEAFEVNVTSNVSGIVDACLKAAPAVEADVGVRAFSWWRLEGMSAKDAEPVLIAAVAHAHARENEAALRNMEPSNRWGSLDGVREALSDLLKAVQANRDGRIRVSG